MNTATRVSPAKAWRSFGIVTSIALASALSMAGMSTAAYADTTPAHAHAPHHPPFGHPGGEGFVPLGGPGLDHFLKEVKATDAQSTQIKSLAQVAQSDLKPLFTTGRSLHDQELALFGKPTVDAAAAENLRQQSLTQHDAISKRVLQFALDVSNVLTAEQRADLVAQIQKRHAEAEAKWHNKANS